MQSEVRDALLKKEVKNSRPKERQLQTVDSGIWTIKTKELLYNFFEPFNIKLSELLNDQWFLLYNKK